MIRRVNVLKWAAYTLCTILLSVFQMQEGFYPKIMDSTPLFAIPLVVSIALLEGETAGGIFGILAGIVWDCGTGRIFGFNALFLMIIGIGIGLFIKFLFHNSGLTVMLFTFIFTVFHEFITWFFFDYMTSIRDLSFAFFHIILPTAILTVIFALPIYFCVRVINHKLTFSEKSDSSI